MLRVSDVCLDCTRLSIVFSQSRHRAPSCASRFLSCAWALLERDIAYMCCMMPQIACWALIDASLDTNLFLSVRICTIFARTCGTFFAHGAFFAPTVDHPRSIFCSRSWNIFCSRAWNIFCSWSIFCSRCSCLTEHLLVGAFFALTSRHNPHGATENTIVRRLGRTDATENTIA